MTSQITLDPSSSTAENLEALAPLVKSIQDTDSEQIYLKSLDAFVGEKEAEIERICEGNYEVGRGTGNRYTAAIVVARVVLMCGCGIGLCVLGSDAFDDPTRNGPSSPSYWRA